ncbi:hypothetical protein HYW40_02775 [Candidatus Curtissbacteria bacterium]|nr:hypothetical protein [Candidatus Curtissbacteria bacterium]
MKKIFFASLVSILVLVFSVSVVLAQTEDKDPAKTRPGEVRREIRDTKKDARDTKKDARGEIREKREDIRDTRKERREEIKERLQAKRVELKERFEKKRKELKDKRFERIVERFRKIANIRREALARLDALADKIQSRIDKLEEAGIDVSAMQAALDACEATKSGADAAIDDSENSSAAVDFDAANAKGLAQAQVAAIRQSNGALKSYHSCLVGVIKSSPKPEREGAGTNEQ